MRLRRYGIMISKPMDIVLMTKETLSKIMIFLKLKNSIKISYFEENTIQNQKNEIIDFG
jgi:hypothetical protein